MINTVNDSIYSILKENDLNFFPKCVFLTERDHNAEDDNITASGKQVN